MPHSLPYRVCFVCSGNICRSPMAEVVLRGMVAKAGLADLVEVDSAGTGDWHVGSGADSRARAALRRRGYDGSAHAARQWRRADFAERDLVVALDTGHYRWLTRLAPDETERTKIRLLRSFDPAAADQHDVLDPYYGPDHGFDEVLDQVEAGCAGILAEVRNALGLGAA
ncbi:MAG TPA: low molecular weight protein-tyrosine-phosphatase [Mycobacteriales bacterium]|nr:low molecular weight protein-tyrosine-phosphatase [Mycobacteriales bacterium]